MIGKGQRERKHQARKNPAKCFQTLYGRIPKAEKTDGVLESTIYPVLTAWGFTTGENRIPTEIKLAELLDKASYEKVKLNENEIQTEPGSMIDMGAVGKGYAGDEAAQVLCERGIPLHCLI